MTRLIDATHLKVCRTVASRLILVMTKEEFRHWNDDHAWVGLDRYCRDFFPGKAAHEHDGS